MVARIFSEWSVELVVEHERDGEWDDTKEDSEERKGGKGEKKRKERNKAWTAARMRAECKLSTEMRFEMSLRLKETVPVRFVRRGNRMV